MISATPLNNRPRDILSQIKLFQNGKNSTIPNLRNLEAFFAAHCYGLRLGECDLFTGFRSDGVPPPRSERLAGHLEAERALALALPDRAFGFHPSPEKWCIKEVVGHLTEEDKRDFVGRIQVMLHQAEPQLNLNDQDRVARERHDCDQDISKLLYEFAVVRSASVAFVESLTSADLERAGVHPKVGIICVRELLHEWLYHDLNHIKQVEGNVQQLLWNQLGNMQAFYKA